LSLGSGTIADPSLRNQSDLEGGQYTVVVSDIFNCSVSDTFDLVQPLEIQLHADLSVSMDGAYNLDCFGGQTGSIALHPDGGHMSVTPYKYLWNQGGTTSSLSNLSAGRYIATVTDSILCSVTDTFDLTEPPLLRIDSTKFSDYNGYDVSCPNNTDGAIRIYVSGGLGDYNYDWNLNGLPLSMDTSNISDLQPGLYNLIITDINNCQLPWNHALDAPPVLNLSIETTNMNCTGTKLGTAAAIVSGGVAPVSYLWDNGFTTPGLSNLDTGIYVLTITDKNLCQETDSTVIEQNTAVLIDIQVSKLISCNGLSDGALQAVARDGVAPYTYLWDDQSTSESISNIDKGNYSVTVTDDDGCIGNAEFDLTDPEPLRASLNISDVQCHGEENGIVSLGAIGGTASYTYYTDNILIAGNEIENVNAGTYNLRIIDAQNCICDTSFVVHQPEPLNISLDKSLMVYPFCPDWENGAIAVTVHGGTRDYQYSWNGYPGDIDSVLNNVKEDTYSMRITDSNGCRADSSFKLRALNNTCLEIPTAFTPNYDFANDTWDISYINENGSDATFYEIYPDGVIQIYDRLGNLVYRCTDGCHESWNGEDLNGRKLPVDTYYYIMELNKGEDPLVLKGIITIIR
jgi:gliding motility-associated-like protein